MLPWTAKIKPEKDEVSILTEMFSNSLLHNEYFQHGTKSNGPSGTKIALMPYEIAHTSSYEPDDTYSDDSRLIQNELAYARSNLDFEMNSFAEYRPYGEKTNDVRGKDMVMPTIWTCVKNAFTMPSR